MAELLAPCKLTSQHTHTTHGTQHRVATGIFRYDYSRGGAKERLVSPYPAGSANRGRESFVEPFPATGVDFDDAGGRDMPCLLQQAVSISRSSGVSCPATHERIDVFPWSVGVAVVIPVAA